MLPAPFPLISPKWQHDTCYVNYGRRNLSPKLSPWPSWKLTLSPHSPASVTLSLSVLLGQPLFPALPLPVPDNFPQMAHQKRFIERKYRQELKEMRRERERQEKETDDVEECRKWQRPFFFFSEGEGGKEPIRTRVCNWGARVGNVEVVASRWSQRCVV